MYAAPYNFVIASDAETHWHYLESDRSVIEVIDLGMNMYRTRLNARNDRFWHKMIKLGGLTLSLWPEGPYIVAY